MRGLGAPNASLPALSRESPAGLPHDLRTWRRCPRWTARHHRRAHGSETRTLEPFARIRAAPARPSSGCCVPLEAPPG